MPWKSNLQWSTLKTIVETKYFQKQRRRLRTTALLVARQRLFRPRMSSFCTKKGMKEKKHSSRALNYLTNKVIRMKLLNCCEVLNCFCFPVKAKGFITTSSTLLSLQTKLLCSFVAPISSLPIASTLPTIRCHRNSFREIQPGILAWLRHLSNDSFGRTGRY